jgi:uncharacterized protein (DUF983 family)
MRQDCPHCHESLDGNFVRSFASRQTDQMRTCPMCGKAMELVVHREELAIRGIAIVVAIATLYWINTGRHGFLLPLVVGTAVLVAAYVVVQRRLKDVPRYQKGTREN